MKKQLLFLFCVLLFQFASAQEFQDTIPFRNDLGLIIIPVKFNGVTKQMAFDTGADRSIAYGWAKESLKATNKTLNIRSSSNLRSKMRFYKSGLIELASRKIRKHRILNAPENDVFSCHQVDGIIGTDIIKLLNWKIDYKNRRLIMFPADHFPEEVDTMFALDFDFRSNRPYVYLTRKRVKLRFLLDTGAGGYSNISKRSFKISNIDDFSGLDVYSGSFDVNGILTKSKSKMFPFPASVSKDVQLSPLIYYDNAKSSKIGNQLWKGKSLFMSLQSKKLWVSSSSIEQSYSGYSCSIVFKEGKMWVLRLIMGSELWNMGVRQGDEILQYNGKKFTDFCSLDQYQRKTVRSGKPFTITLKNGKIITISKKNIFKK